MGLLGASLRDLLNSRPMDIAVVDANGDQITNFTSSVTPPANAALTSVGSSATSVILLASNPNRRRFVIVNDGSKILYIAFAATASLTAFTIKLGGGGSYESPLNDYTGDVSGIWQAVNGNARITEITV